MAPRLHPTYAHVDAVDEDDRDEGDDRLSNRFPEGKWEEKYPAGLPVTVDGSKVAE